MTESWDEVASTCRQARLYHHAFTIAGKEVELDAMAQLMDSGVGVREIARLTRVPRSTVSRLCQDLAAAVQQVEIERAEVDSELLEFARRTIRAPDGARPTAP